MRALGIILAGGNNNKMRELSNKRAVAAMPVAGSFRSIDLRCQAWQTLIFRRWLS